MTPSQLFRQAAPARAGSYFERVPQSWGKLPSEDGPAIFRSEPGDVLPDGSIATPLTSGGSRFSGIVMTVDDVVAGGDDGDGLLERDVADDNTALGGAPPFEYAEDSPLGDVLDLAASNISMGADAECFEEYEFDLEQCNVVYAMTKDPRAVAVCKERAFSNYQLCRGM